MSTDDRWDPEWDKEDLVNVVKAANELAKTTSKRTVSWLNKNYKRVESPPVTWKIDGSGRPRRLYKKSVLLAWAKDPKAYPNVAAIPQRNPDKKKPGRPKLEPVNAKRTKKLGRRTDVLIDNIPPGAEALDSARIFLKRLEEIQAKHEALHKEAREALEEAKEYLEVTKINVEVTAGMVDDTRKRVGKLSETIELLEKSRKNTEIDSK